jgi:flagellar motor protein MotB
VPQHQAPARTTQTAPRPSQSTANPNLGQTTSQAQREAAARPQKEQANQQKDQMKRQQEQQKEQARQQKNQMKQQQKQQKEQARQQKEEMKRQQKQQKEQARQQKELQKHPGQSANPAVSRPLPAASSGVGASASEPSRSRSAASPIYKAPESSAVAGKTPTGARTLTENGSRATLQQVNSARSNLSGINRKPLPPGDVSIHPNGRLTVEAAGGVKYGVRSNGTISSYRDREKSVNFDKRGKVSSLRTANLSVRRDPNGVRTIESRRADNSRVVSTGRHSGYVERNIVVGNRTYVQRTTIINQRITTNTFVAYNYGGVALTHFVAPVFYSPAFYGWAYYPWAAPVRFGFGWFGAAWYVAPNPFFTAYPVYPSAAFWLTDYMLGETLATAYQLHEDALASETNDAEYTADAASSDGMHDGDQPDMLQADATTPITPELKAQIAEEVKQQIEYDNYTSANPTHETSYDELPTVLGQPNHLFIVSSSLDVTTDDQQECGLQAGDLLRLVSPPANDAAIVELRVASSKQMDCPAGVMVGVSLQDLQEMQNSFRSQIESGLASLTASQGHGGIPVAPPNAVAAPPRPTLTGLTPVTAIDLTPTLEEQRQQADQAEAQAVASSF